ncbi:hypothetical protein HPB50_027220 [Hyalomma asiaticum]|uniref:Uncharacterized protein n=1 Tax=Hyalomma asiaticum TaxID=266040 RepID=A0ACB7TV50_HYAAI|nr:hypothetical protein HPB50_027220 [Hyalomma asiaticum]
MNAPAVRLPLCACKLGQAGSKRHLRDPRLLSDGGLSSSDALNETEDPEEQQDDNPGAMDPANILTVLNHCMTKNCGAVHRTSVFGVADGWRARVSVAPPNYQLPNVQTHEVERINAASPVHGLKSRSRHRVLSRAQSIIHNIYAYVSNIKNNKSLMPVYLSNNRARFCTLDVNHRSEVHGHVSWCTKAVP